MTLEATTTDEKIDFLITKLDVIDTKLESLTTNVKTIKEKVKKLKKSQNKTQQNTEDLERRFIARETFPLPPPDYPNPPKPAQAVEQGSVSKPVWGKRSIYG